MNSLHDTLHYTLPTLLGPGNTSGVFKTVDQGQGLTFTNNEINSPVFGRLQRNGFSIIVSTQVIDGSMAIYSNRNLINPVFVIQRKEAMYLNGVLDSRDRKQNGGYTPYEGFINFNYENGTADGKSLDRDN